MAARTKTPTTTRATKKAKAEAGADSSNGAKPTAKKEPTPVKISEAKGRPMLHWVSKRPLESIYPYPAQVVETFSADDKAGIEPNLLFHGDNKEVLAYLLTNGYRRSVNLIYIDPPFNTGVDNYVRRVQLRNTSLAKIEGETMSVIEQVQYANSFFPDLFLQLIYERLLILKELLHDDGVLVLRIDYRYAHYIKVILDEVFTNSSCINEIIIARQRESAGSPNKLEITTESLFVYARSNRFTFNKPRVNRPVANIQWTAFLMGGERFPRERIFLGLTLTPPAGQHFSLKQEKVNKLLTERFLRLRCRQCGALHYFGESQESLERYMRKKENRFKFYDIYAGREYFAAQELKNCQSCSAVNFTVEYLGSDEEAVSNNWTDIPSYAQTTGYPTENSEALLNRVIETYSNGGDLVLDCFMGSGTTAAVSQRKGRRWIGCDINKGAIQTTSKRLQKIILEQVEEAQQGKLDLGADSDGKKIEPALSFKHYRINDYDLQLQHNEALELALEHIGVTRTRTDSFFEGQLGKKLVKVVPLVHPCTMLDVQLVENELKRRPDEDRDVIMVSLGKDTNVDTHLAERNKHKPVNKIELIELRTDPKYGNFFVHQAAWAHVAWQRKEEVLRIEITDFSSPTILQRLSMNETIFRERVTDFRAMIDVVLVDTDYNGEVFNIRYSDVPERKTDFVKAKYEFPMESGKRTAAVKIIDMLGEEVLITKEI